MFVSLNNKIYFFKSYELKNSFITNAGWSKWLGTWFPLSKVLDSSIVDAENRQ